MFILPFFCQATCLLRPICIEILVDVQSRFHCTALCSVGMYNVVVGQQISGAKLAEIITFRIAVRNLIYRVQNKAKGV